MKLAIVGSRNIVAFDLGSVVPPGVSAIISGGAAGVDRLARDYALSRGLKLVEILPEYQKFGRRAPLLRNLKIVDSSDRVLAVWDGRSKGTLHSISYAKATGKPVELINIFKDR